MLYISFAHDTSSRSGFQNPDPMGRRDGDKWRGAHSWKPSLLSFRVAVKVVLCVASCPCVDFLEPVCHLYQLTLIG